MDSQLEEQRKVLAIERKIKSIVGFMEQTLPLSIAVSMLEPKDILKLSCLTKSVRISFFSNISAFTKYQSVYKDKINE